MARIGLVAVSLLAFLWAAGGASALTCPNTMRITLKSDATILVEGKATTLAALDAELTKLDAKSGSVWYFREDSQKPPTGMVEDTMHKIFELLVKHKRPVSFSSRADFGDVIDDQGNVTPRTKC